MLAQPKNLSTRELILDSAQQLFGRKGLEATTIKQIGAESGLNPALLYYYFADKQNLYRAILQRIGEGLIARGGAALLTAATPPEAIRALVLAQMQFLLANPDAPKLIIRELLDHEARHAEAMILQVASGIFQRLCAVIEAGQRAGEFRPDLEPKFAAVSTISQVIYFTIARPAVGIFLGHGPGGVPEETADAFGRHAADFALSALSNRELPA
jgi:TetR/AcrR family transcriptional regulator